MGTAIRRVLAHRAIPFGTRVPDDRWAFAACPDGWPGQPSTTDICFKDRFQNQHNYHLIYRGNRLAGDGAGLRHIAPYFVAFLRSAKTDDEGGASIPSHPSILFCARAFPRAGCTTATIFVFGFNEDERGQRVCDGMHIHIAGAQRLFLNYRFAQPNPFTQQHREAPRPGRGFQSLM